MITRRVSGPWLRERIYTGFCVLAAFASVATTLGIIAMLGVETLAFFRQPEVTVWEFFTGTEWRPTFLNPKFGIWPLVSGTMMITVGAALVALPLGLGCGIYLGEYANVRARQILKPTLELLAGIPTVVYGFFALMHVTPMLRKFVPDLGVFNALSGCIVVGVMILPLVASLCDDAITAVPRSLREGAMALGSTRFEVTTKVVLPAAISGIMASFILAISRAVGETMAVTLAAGQQPTMTFDPRLAIQTMTSYIVQISKGDAPAGSTASLTLFAVGAMLFVMTLGLSVLSRKIVKAYRLIAV